MFTYTSCPLCKNTAFKPFITCTDYTVSKQKFPIVSCDACGFKFTNPVPEISELGNYYKSDEYVSHSNTRKGLVHRLYHLVRNYTLKKKLQLVSSYVSRGTILDYGCGTGMFLKVCDNAGWSVLGVEPDSGAREAGNKMGLSIQERKQDLLKVFNKKLDVITLWHVLEHVTDLSETLQFFKENLDNGGVLIIAVPNHKSSDAMYYEEFWAAYDVPRHLYHFEKSTMQSLLSRHGFKLIATKPMSFDSFYVSMLSEKYKTGSIGYIKAIWRGLTSNIKARSSGEYSSLIYVFKPA
jgi:2-polyprenyl-3-methyl-5-hydroxy-6-metoxy-1,4-benzoquinol methylase